MLVGPDPCGPKTGARGDRAGRRAPQGQVAAGQDPLEPLGSSGEPKTARWSCFQPPASSSRWRVRRRTPRWCKPGESSRAPFPAASGQIGDRRRDDGPVVLDHRPLRVVAREHERPPLLGAQGPAELLRGASLPQLGAGPLPARPSQAVEVPPSDRPAEVAPRPVAVVLPGLPRTSSPRVDVGPRQSSPKVAEPARHRHPLDSGSHSLYLDPTRATLPSLEVWIGCPPTA